MESENLEDIKTHISRMSGVPANLITGEDRHSLEENTQKLVCYAEEQRKAYLKSLIPTAPHEEAPGSFANCCGPFGDEEKREFVARLFCRE